MGKLLTKDAFLGGSPRGKTVSMGNGSVGPMVGSDMATFAAGPAWSVEPAFHRRPGVLETTIGYAGGDLPHPTYLDVFCERSGHAEAVQVRYDRSVTSYSDLLEIFWTCHDPTQLNRQGPDIGIQYRSVIFCNNGAQMMLARRSRDLKEQSDLFLRPIVTQIELLQHFWRAEDTLQKQPPGPEEPQASESAKEVRKPRSGA